MSLTATQTTSIKEFTTMPTGPEISKDTESPPEAAKPASSQIAVPTPEFLEELAQAAQSLEDAEPAEIIRWGAERFGTKMTMGTAFGPEGCVILHLLAEIAPNTPVFNLDTGYQFQETLDVRDNIAAKYGIEVELLKPDLTVPQYEAKHGGPLYQSDPTQCCFDRKLTVLKRAAQGMDAWISAIRRDQSPDRAKAAIVGWDNKFGLVKLNPLANKDKKWVWQMILEHSIPYNVLHDQGYTSIGCWPCTRAVLAGEDERAGRWSGTGKTECGLHTLSDD